MSYIDREKVKEFVRQYFHAVIDSGEHEVNAVDCGVELYRVISDMPAADVVKVNRGKWIKKPFISGLSKRTVKNEFVFTCSACGFDSICTSDYCRKCGAKMDDR